MHAPQHSLGGLPHRAPASAPPISWAVPLPGGTRTRKKWAGMGSWAFGKTYWNQNGELDGGGPEEGTSCTCFGLPLAPPSALLQRLAAPCSVVAAASHGGGQHQHQHQHRAQDTGTKT